MEGAMATIGGFCVGSHFIAEHQRLSGLGYIFSASLPPMLTQAAISSLDRFEREPQIFEELQQKCRLVQKLFQRFSKLQLGGDDLSPIKHLYVALPLENFQTELKLLTQVADKVRNKVKKKLRNLLKPLSSPPTVHWAGRSRRRSGLSAESRAKASASQSTHRHKSPALRWRNSDSVPDHWDSLQGSSLNNPFVIGSNHLA